MLDYWNMTDKDLKEAYLAADAAYQPPYVDPTGELLEELMFAEDAVLQRMGAPEDADPGTQKIWAEAVKEWARAPLAR